MRHYDMPTSVAVDPIELEEDLELEGDSAADRKLPAPLGVPELLAVEEPEEAWLVEEVIPVDANVLQAGYPKTYKTFWLLELARALASGTPFLGHFDVPERRRVGIVLMEDQAHRVRRRLERLCQGRGMRLDALDGWLHIWFRPPLRLTDQTATELADYVAELELDFLGIDSWAYVASGNSDDADDVTPQLQTLSAVRTRRPGLTVQLTHHARKERGDGGGNRLTDIIRNSSAFGAWYDAGLVLSRKDEQSPVSVRTELRDHPAPDTFAFTVDDEYPAGPDNRFRSDGWLRLQVSDHRPELLERMVAAERLEPAVREFVGANPGTSKRQLREGVTGRNRDKDAALELLESRGEVRIQPPEGPGKASRIYLLRGTS